MQSEVFAQHPVGPDFGISKVFIGLGLIYGHRYIMT
jgi:hypothetical protein